MYVSENGQVKLVLYRGSFSIFLMSLRRFSNSLQKDRMFDFGVIATVICKIFFGSTLPEKTAFAKFCEHDTPTEVNVYLALSFLSFQLQVQLLPPDDVSELSVVIRESPPLSPIQQGTFPPWATSQTPRTLVLQPTVDDCALVASREKVDV